MDNPNAPPYSLFIGARETPKATETTMTTTTKPAGDVITNDDLRALHAAYSAAVVTPETLIRLLDQEACAARAYCTAFTKTQWDDNIWLKATADQHLLTWARYAIALIALLPDDHARIAYLRRNVDRMPMSVRESAATWLLLSL